MAELLIKIGGDSSGLRKEIQASQRQLKRAFGTEALDASAKMAAGLGVITAAAGAFAVAAGKMAVGWNLAVNTLGDVTGMSGEAGSKLLATAQLVGVSGDDMAAALVKMSNNAEKAFESIKENGANSTDAFTKFGIAVQDSNGNMLSAEQIYANVAARHREMADGVQKTAMEIQIFGKSGAKLNDLLNLSEQQMADLTARAEKMGLVVGTQQAAAWESATFELNRAKLGFTAAGNAVITELLPSLASGATAAADMLEAFAVDTKMHGITTALKNLIPDSLEPAIMGVSTALLGYAVPAIIMTGYRAALALGPLGWFGIALGVIAGLAVDTGNALAKMGDKADDAVARLNGFNPVATTFDQVGASASVAAAAMERFNKVHSERRGGSWGDLATGAAAAGTGTAGAAKAYNDLAKEAERTSKSIEREWVQLTRTQIEQLDKWYADETATLEKTRSANENYERDLLRLKETYDARKKKIDEAEYDRVVNLKRAAIDAVTGNQNRVSGIGLTGSAKQAADFRTGMEGEITAVTRKYEDMTTEFATLDDAAKTNNIKAWQEAGLLFKVNQDGTVDFTEEAEKQKLAIRKDYWQKYQDYLETGQAFQADLDAARSKGRIDSFIALLNSEQGAMAQDLAGRQFLIESYYEAWKATHMSAMETMATVTNGVASAFETAISSAVMGSSDAWQQLGQSIRKVFADMLASYIANSLKMSILGNAAQAASVAVSVAAGAATAAAWAPAAAMVSLASFGGNSGPAMAGIGATVGFATALSIPKFAEGGIVTGRTIAEIGEGRYSEAVLPLNRRAFEKVGLVGQGGNTVHVQQNVHGDINTEADTEEIMEDLGRMIQNAIMGGLA